MSLEIRELHIKVTVNQDAEQTSPSSAAEPLNNAPPPTGDKSAIVSECIEQVLEILKERMEA